MISDVCSRSFTKEFLEPVCTLHMFAREVYTKIFLWVCWMTFTSGPLNLVTGSTKPKSS